MKFSKYLIISVIAMFTWMSSSLIQAKTLLVDQNQKTISGIVTDTSGEPIIGASIRVKDSTIGAVTNFEGEFTLDTPETGILEITYIGYIPQEFSLADRVEFTVQLVEDTRQLDEVVVVGYGTQKKVNLTGAVTSVNMDEVLGNRPIGNVTNALLGNVPGLVMTGFSGEPGTTYNIRVRGTSSINAGDPLILVDNVPMSISDINPADIESVSVLKDASASAVYGARAAFGVILVTTKKSGKDKPNRFNYSTKLSFSNPQELLKRATPLQTVKGVQDAGYVTMWTGHDVATWMNLLQQYESNSSLFPDGYGVVDGVRYSLKETDLTRDLMSDYGFQQIHDFSVSGGSSKSVYRISLGVLDEDGILVTNKDSYRRYNVSSFLSVDATKWITAQLSMMYSNSKKLDPYDVTIRTNNMWAQSVSAPSYYPTGEMEINGEYYPFDTPRNMMEVAIPNKSISNRLNLTGRLLINPFDGLTITGEYSINRSFQSFNRYRVPIHNFISGISFSFEPSSLAESIYRETKNQNDYNALNLFGTYNKRLQDHEFMITGGINSEYSYFEELWSERQQMINDELPSIGQGVGLITSSDDFSEYAIFGTFYRFNYSLKDRYLLEASGRYDGSSKFPRENRFGFFPSFSGGWRVSEEAFLKKYDPFLSNLKLRASWGSIGNQNIDPYSYTPGMNANLSRWIVGGQQALTLSTPALVRSNFTWEKVQTTNFGIDLGLFKSKLSGSFDIFRRETLNMLGPGADYPAILGAGAPLQNAADMYTTGWELQLSWRDRFRDISYGLGFNLSDNKSKITKFYNESKILSTHYEGKTMGEVWGYVFDRFYTVDDFVEGSLKTTAAGELTGGTLKEGIPQFRGYNPNPGDYLFKYPDKEGQIWASTNTLDDPGSQRIIGNSTPRYIYGFSGDVSWKGFGLSFLLQGIGKRDLWMGNNTFIPYRQNFRVGLFEHQLDYWRPDNTNAFFARIYQSASYNTAANTQVNDKLLVNASYLDIKSVMFSYTLPKHIVSGLSLNEVNLFVNGENLWTFNHLPKGIHPDNRLRDEGATYPMMRMFTCGLNVTF